MRKCLDIVPRHQGCTLHRTKYIMGAIPTQLYNTPGVSVATRLTSQMRKLRLGEVKIICPR